MPKLGLANMILGFCIILLSSSGGAFVSTDTIQAFVANPGHLSSWELTLLRSAHGHFNLFGILHILMGLTLPYNRLPAKIKGLMTWGLLMGAVGVGPFLVIRAYSAPSLDYDGLTVMTGVLLAAGLASIATHIYGLWLKCNEIK